MANKPLKIRAIRKERGMTLKELARLAGMSEAYLSHIERGERRANLEYLEKLARALNVDQTELVDSAAARTAPVVGLVVDGGAVIPEHAHNILCPPQITYYRTQALIIRGDSFVPIFPDGSAIFFARPDDRAITKNFSLPVVAETFDRKIWFRQIVQGDSPDTFHLLPLTRSGAPIWNVKLRWAEPMCFLLLPEKVENVSPVSK